MQKKSKTKAKAELKQKTKAKVNAKLKAKVKSTSKKMAKPSSDSKSVIKIGLTGNPNTGKSTLFNALTGAKQHVGNWPGKTVEKKEGKISYNDTIFHIVDLPGAYSLTAYTEEESVTSNFILEEKPDVILQIIDAQNFERNLYMTIQLIELQAPLVLALNMNDLAEKEGMIIDTKELSTLLNIPVVKIDAKKKQGLEKLLSVIEKQAKTKQKAKIKLTYAGDINAELNKLKEFIRSHDKKIKEKELNYISLKLLEGDIRIEQLLTKKPYYLELKAILDKSLIHLRTIYKRDIHSILAHTRYGFIRGLCRDVLVTSATSAKKQRNSHIKRSKNAISAGNRSCTSISDRIDSLLLNKFIGLPIFLVIAWFMFQATFVFSKPLMGWLEAFFAYLGSSLAEILQAWKSPEWLISLIVDGIIGGVGGILVFIPIIGVLFLIISIMEDSGYMARVAYMMDKLMHKLGLHGKAFIPLVLGFGCNVPGIMATRTLQTKRDRLLTILISPFMSCGARLPVYVLFTGVFFAKYQGWVIFSLYFIGIAVAIIIGIFFRMIFAKSLSSPFVIELPQYRWPAISGLFFHAWKHVWLFIKKAGVVILAFSIIIWFLASMPYGVKYGSEDSFAGVTGKAISPIFEPLGFGNWQSSVALTFGFTAKEVIVGTFGTLYGIDEASGVGTDEDDDNTHIYACATPTETSSKNLECEPSGTDETTSMSTNKATKSTTSLGNALQKDFTPLSAYSFMVFVLLYVPCVATLAVVKSETNSWKWPLFMVLYTFGIAWAVSFLVFQGGKLLGFT